MNPRRLLLEWFDHALRAVDGEQSVAESLRQLGPVPVALFAVGKAASSMALGARGALGHRIRQALLITKDGHVDPRLGDWPEILVMESAHPVPDERSLAAGAELVRRLAELPADTCPVFLVSGGSSSLVESLHAGRTLDELRELNVRGLASGWDIVRLNAERSKLSRLKGGGIAQLLGGRPAHALFISDVPGDEPGVIGSGLLGGAPGRADEVRRIVVANNDSATHWAGVAAKSHGLELDIGTRRFDGDAAQVAAEFVEALRNTAADGLVWGGESTVTLPPHPGRGGRNQHLALSAAKLLRANEPFTILAAGTDGTDGPTDDAGAIVDSGTVERAEIAGADVERALREFDSGTALEAAGDLVHTGPTGTNVGDILIGLKSIVDIEARARRLRDPAAARML
jgi:glycerate 2-kinase